VLAALAFLVLGAIVYGDHVLDGGFVLDDWTNFAMVDFHPGGILADYAAFLSVSYSRPLAGLPTAVLGNVFGQHMGLWLAWTAGLGVPVSLGVFWILRLLGFRTVDAFAVGALVYVFNGSSTLRLWMSGGGEQIAIAWTLLGFVLALYALRAHGRRALVLHGASLMLYLAALLFVEMTLSVMLASVLLYLLVAPWRAAVARWAVDVAVLAPVALLVTTSQGARSPQDLGGMIEHARLIADQSWTLFMTVVIPFTVDWWQVVIPLVAIVVASIVVARRAPAGSPQRTILLRWLASAGAGLVFVAISYAIYAPADNWYVPLQPGVGNRINGVAAIGWMLLGYAVLRLLAELVVRRRLVAVAAPVLSLMFAGVYVERTLQDARAYQDGFATGRETLLALRDAIPDPPDDAMVYAFGQPLETAPGIPVFHSTWDLTSAAQVMWHDQSVRALPAFPSLQLQCRAGDVVPVIWDNPVVGEPFRSRYGRTFFVDTQTGTGLAITSRRICQDAAKTWARSPLYPVAPASG
jgi:hypothetical protein